MNTSTQQFISTHRYNDVQQLALQFNAKNLPEVDLPFALTQIAGRQKIEHKIPSWYEQDDLLFPQRLSLEQCSSEATARYKAEMTPNSFKGVLVDLTGGFGVDTAFLAPHFSQVIYVEKQPELAQVALHYFAMLVLSYIQVQNTNSLEFLQTMPPVDCIYIDPARRSVAGKKIAGITDCEPNLLDIQALLLAKAQTVLIKLSPMLDIHAALQQLQHVAEVHVVSVDNECKEILFLLNKNASEESVITCVNLKKSPQPAINFTFPEEKFAKITYTCHILNYLYEANASILKAGFFKGLALRYGIEKLHPDSHLYTSTEFIPDFPGRIFQVESVVSFNKKSLKENLGDLEQANLSVRNFPLSVNELRKKLRLKEGGAVYLFATTLANGEKVILKGKKL
ncbi:hypothetical protein FACS1894176_10340 [Bacteroidia bacterium]|nr:hypothetical protein FACS1894176_10340 [Bacteroidia bacterium]